jgi:hypothetical protein
MSRRHASTSVFRVRILGGFYAPSGGPSIWREIELAADQTLGELGEAIPAAFGFDDDTCGRSSSAASHGIGPAAGNLTLADGKELARLLGLVDQSAAPPGGRWRR